MARAGAAVAVVDFRPEPAHAVAEASWRRAAGRSPSRPTCGRGGDQRGGEATVEQLGGLHIVFANAGINGMQTPIEEMTLDEWHATIETNLTGTFLTVKHSIPHLRAAGGGSIVITASVNGNRLFSLPGYSAYSTSKAGAGGLRADGGARAGALGDPRQHDPPRRDPDEHRRADLPAQPRRVSYDFTMPEKFPPLAGRAAAWRSPIWCSSSPPTPAAT